MAKTLDRSRPKSTIADMIDGDLIEQATQNADGPQPQPDKPTNPPAIPVTPVPGAGARRTGEHTDIEKMYRLTPTAQRTVQQLSMKLGMQLGFDVNRSVVIRSVLRVMHNAWPEIERSIEEGLTPRKQPSTAIGNEHTRDAIEAEIADALSWGIHRHAGSKTKD